MNEEFFMTKAMILFVLTKKNIFSEFLFTYFIIQTLCKLHLIALNNYETVFELQMLFNYELQHFEKLLQILCFSVRIVLMQIHF